MVLLNRRHPVADRQGGQLLEAVIKECIRACHERAGTGLAKGREGLFKFCIVAAVQNIESDPEFQRPRANPVSPSRPMDFLD